MHQPIREDGPISHFQKANTPTMGGIVIFLSVIVVSLLFCNLENKYVWLAIFCFTAFSLIGAIDDINKLFRRSDKGLSEKQKLLLQSFFSLILVSVLLWLGSRTLIHVPFTKDMLIDLGVLGYLLFGVFVITGSSNATNLTDGLDGLAVGNLAIILGVLVVFCYLAGTAPVAKYLGIFYVSGASELSVFLSTLCGACVGFLWHNCYPASTFMGDTGSLGIGAVIGYSAIISKQELPFAIASGVLVVEALSVLIQRYYFKLSGGKRIFKMAPLHHHFELIGWSEPKIIIRFWIVSVLLAIISLSTLKIR
ncbi:MAG: phospho-N-acetylmuramoyl-pentapeptide-transferase [Deltaproteobacteria bacterium]|nr:phospho-N-acetylmuramoyl-pentapeptide-transferase [Deltaproteobacteria bacterium]